MNNKYTKQHLSMMYAGKVLAILLDIKLPEMIKVGINILNLEKFIFKYIIENKCFPATKGKKFGDIFFFNSACISINSSPIHNIPVSYIIKELDMIKIDIVLYYNGFHVDAARTYIAYSSKTPNYIQRNIIITAKKIVEEVKNNIFLGETTSSITKYIDKIIKKSDFSTLSNFGGHFIGEEMHMLPFISNTLQNIDFLNEKILQEGMCFTVEPVLLFPKNSIYYIDDDMWSVKTNAKYTSHWEDTFGFYKKKLYEYTNIRQYNL